MMILFDQKRNPAIDSETYLRMIYGRLNSQRGAYRYTRTIIPVSLRDELIERLEGAGLRVLPQWFDGIDEHSEAVYLTVWDDTSVDTPFPMPVKPQKQYSEVVCTVSSSTRKTPWM